MKNSGASMLANQGTSLFLFSSRFYFILYEVDSPLRIRYDRYSNKYTGSDKSSLEGFIEIDDGVKYNTDEYSLYNILGEQQHLIKRRFYNNSDDMLQFR